MEKLQPGTVLQLSFSFCWRSYNSIRYPDKFPDKSILPRRGDLGDEIARERMAMT